MACPANGQAAGSVIAAEVADEILQQREERLATDLLPNNEILLTSAQLTVTIGEESSTTTFAGRQHNDGRYHSAKKTNFKLVKNGKILDEYLRTFFMDEILVASGILSKGRYLFVIRNLRI